MSNTRDMEIRHLPIPQILKLSEILDKNKTWEKLMEKIPKNLHDMYDVTSNFHSLKKKYSVENIQ